MIVVTGAAGRLGRMMAQLQGWRPLHDWRCRLPMTRVPQAYSSTGSVV